MSLYTRACCCCGVYKCVVCLWSAWPLYLWANEAMCSKNCFTIDSVVCLSTVVWKTLSYHGNNTVLITPLSAELDVQWHPQMSSNAPCWSYWLHIRMYSWFQVLCPIMVQQKAKLINQVLCTWWRFGICSSHLMGQFGFCFFLQWDRQPKLTVPKTAWWIHCTNSGRCEYCPVCVDEHTYAARDRSVHTMYVYVRTYVRMCSAVQPLL